MSEIRANTVSDAAGTGPVTLTKQSAAKAWVNFNGTGTVAIRDSFNVSTITDNGTGDYTRTVSSAFANVDYSSSGGGGLTSTSVGTFSHHTNASPTTTAFRMQTANFAMNSLIDWTYVEVNSHGDLA